MGAYWFDEDNIYASTTTSGSRTNPAAALTSTVGLTTQKSTSSALFGQATYSLTDAILGATCVFDNSCHSVCLIADGIEAMQHLCHGAFKIKLRARKLCSRAVRRSASLSL